MCAAHVCASTLSSQSTPRTCQSADSRVKTTVKASRKKTKTKTHKQDLPSWPSTRPSASMCSARPRSSRRRAACLQVSHAHVAGRREGGGRQGERRRVHPDAHFTRTKSREEKIRRESCTRARTRTQKESSGLFSATRLHDAPLSADKEEKAVSSGDASFSPRAAQICVYARACVAALKWQTVISESSVVLYMQGFTYHGVDVR